MRRSVFSTLPLLTAGAAAACLAACSGDRERPGSFPAEAVEPALGTITVPDLMAHIDVLASDSFEGRAPGTPGEEKTVAYLTEQFRTLGLEPGNPDGSWTQGVTLVGIRNQATGSVRVGGETIPLRFPENLVAVSYRDAPSVVVDNSALVFVGYGVEAPEYGWDDYGGRDMTGKTLIMLVNDPQVRLAGDTALDPEVFNGRAMTYYGRWTYKYEVGAGKGADAVIVVHETGPAGYPWEVVTGSWGPEQFGIAGGGGPTPVKVEAWITEETARRMLSAAGHDFDALKERARTRGFQPIDLDGTASFDVTMERRQVSSQNVIARLPGSDDDVADEHVVYTAHWDHLGRDPSLDGDQIFNGALDNATGTAGLLEIAEAFASLAEAPRRSILFLAVTAEEKGLLGARYYAENPLYPLEKTLANINMDGLNQWGRTEDVVVIGMGNSSLDDVLRRHADARGRTLVPDPEPEKGFFYRSDHFQFAKQGVPALYMDQGTHYIGQPEGYGEQKRAEYTANDYHKPSDEVKPDWDLAGAVEDLGLMFLVGYEVAEGDIWPTWREGNEFRARRESMLGSP
ncbi:MAG TPA: M28 family metallopeptidase [Longimicrobiales bacterium]|nr:M28 family metallopeptidase [Longimicrobiales bacterium]